MCLRGGSVARDHEGRGAGAGAFVLVLGCQLVALLRMLMLARRQS